MFSRLLTGALAAAWLISGCANGWPHTHHLAAPKTTLSCTPSGSRIPRYGCSTDQSVTQTSQDEYDREGLGPGGAPLQSPGNMNAPRS